MNGNKEFLQNLIKSIFSLHNFDFDTLHKTRSINIIHYDDVGKGTEEIQNTSLFYIMCNEINGLGYFINPTTKNYSLFQLQFKILYQTELNLNVNIVKDLYKEGNFKKEININQNNNIVDLDKFVSYAKDSLISTGNEELQYVKVVSSYDDCFKLGQYNSDGFVVSQVVNIQNRELWYSRMLATKDFQNANGFYKPSQELIKYAIKKDAIFNRNILIKEAIILDDNEKKYKTTLPLNYLNIFKNNLNDSKESYIILNNKIIKNANVGYYKNISYAKTQFNSPIIAGKTNYNNTIFYTNTQNIDNTIYTNGELNNISFEIIKYDFVNKKYDFVSNVDYINDFPSYEGEGMNDYVLNDKILKIKNVKILKDPDETLSLEYQIHYLSNKAYIIIGPAFAKYNIFHNNSEKVFFISNKKYNIHDNIADDIIEANSNLAYYSDNSITLSTDKNYVSWGMIDSITKEIYFVVNNNTVKKLYFNFKNIMV